LLPFIGEKKLAGTDGTDTIYHTVQPFSFINQFRDTISEKTINNKIYVADFFFASCQSICPKMSSQLVQVQNAFKNDTSVLILSHTVNPSRDTVEVLNGYAQSYGALKNKWHFLTGNKKAIYDVARYSYLVNALEEDGSVEGFLHSELFILVDSKKRIRGMYDGTDSIAVVKLISDIKLLKQE
jgi:protein SCO1/2